LGVAARARTDGYSTRSGSSNNGGRPVGNCNTGAGRLGAIEQLIGNPIVARTGRGVVATRGLFASRLCSLQKMFGDLSH
jgi:hypothetical protein